MHQFYYAHPVDLLQCMQTDTSEAIQQLVPAHHIEVKIQHNKGFTTFELDILAGIEMWLKQRESQM